MAVASPLLILLSSTALRPTTRSERPRQSADRRRVLAVALGAAVARLPLRGETIPPIEALLPPEQLNAAQSAAAVQTPPATVYSPPTVKGASSPRALALARQLKAKGAKMYGAHWCSHCFSQKQLFGAPANRLIDYVECAADGYKSQRGLCQAKEIKGYPTWEIGGRFFRGEKTLDELEEILEG
ncbi:hypothetical protein EMIHUDRAFT_202968 [Emiliania huxleyi CCMP1516]|uniref:Thioredoxin domain-containing protein n=2 Tax=Emiliania huxleyi TaxID=2903 RepID=A0A0D3IXD5_EMIH1|nr:hypothetical protein EMIHUDRAFT_102999 [Emiliania huxleyi CCMP1516]XP_005783360.1 hypothetical protein EMIHUDRAFT_202968 [Emiliania huxleyi CCMP1516]EOD15920.1 hypothetical protein EMIHUDRAFT_102999 [Emiliania huxleyi CCMP1516]EOD30931.1 hypothetical protein EMIHUDRAFT_202968 [Emiliania huxleyi CCMP1516]|eukprot:XP_005768349.1 hypothetical protein EMIHUDRAFT_102999 [Emiliania huxleyi CCMP1516]